MHCVKSAFVEVWDSVSQSNKSRARKEMLMSAAFIQQWQIQSEKLVANDKERERRENRQWKCNGALVKAVHEQSESRNTHCFCLVSDSLPLTSTQNTWHTGSLISRRASVWTSFLSVPPPLPATWEWEEAATAQEVEEFLSSSSPAVGESSFTDFSLLSASVMSMP